MSEGLFDSLHCPVKQSRMIEASAGTGKTYTIQNLFVRAILEGTALERIVVVTYTEAATGELIDRIRSILRDVYRAIKDDAPLADERLRFLKARYGTDETRKTSLDYLENALLNFERAQISTMHGFCQRVLKEYAFECNMLFNTPLCTDAHAQLRACINDYKRRVIYGLPDGYSYAFNEEAVINNFNTGVMAIEDADGNVISVAPYDTIDKLEPFRPEDYADDPAAMKYAFYAHAARGVATLFEQRKKEEQFYTFNDLLARVRQRLTADADDKLLRALQSAYDLIFIDEFQDTDVMQYEIFRALAPLEHSSCALITVGDPKQSIYSFRGGDIYVYNRARNAVKERATLCENYRTSRELLAIINDMYAACASPFLCSTESGNENELSIPFQPSRHPEKGKASKGDPNGSSLQVILLDAEVDRETIIDNIPAAVAYEFARGVPYHRIAVLCRTKNMVIRVRNALDCAGIPSACYVDKNLFDTPEAAAISTLLDAVLNPHRKQKVFNFLNTAFSPYDRATLARLHADQEPALYDTITQKLALLRDLWQNNSIAALRNELNSDAGFMLIDALEQNVGIRSSMVLTTINALFDLLYAVESRERMMPAELCAFVKMQCCEKSRTLFDEAAAPSDTADNGVQIMTLHKSKGLEFETVIIPDADTLCDHPNGPYPTLRYIQGQRCYFPGESGDYKGQKDARMELFREQLRLFYVGITRAEQKCILYWLPQGTRSRLKFSPLHYYFDPYVRTCEAESKTPLELYSRLIDKTYSADGDKFMRIKNDLSAKKLLHGLYAPSDIAAVTAQTLQQRRFSHSIRRDWQISSFSSIASGHHALKKLCFEAEKENDESESNGEIEAPNTVIEDVFLFPRGAAVGDALHMVAELSDFTRPLNAQLIGSILQRFALPGYEPATHIPCVQHLFERLLARPLMPDHICLRDLPYAKRISELRFDFALKPFDLNELHACISRYVREQLKIENTFEPMDKTVISGLLTGFIDLFFEVQDRFFVLDWKSNYLGDTPADYMPEKLSGVMVEHNYVLQALLYSCAVMRYLRMRYHAESYETLYHARFGGIYYLFLRGAGCSHNAENCGVFHDRPPLETLLELERIFQ